MNVVLANRQRTRKINLRLLKQIADALLAGLKIENAELGVHLVATPEMIRLNEKFLRHAGPTDVITFDYADPKRQAHGEIFICMDEAVLQARKFRTSWQSEIARYLVHGVLDSNVPISEARQALVVLQQAGVPSDLVALEARLRRMNPLAPIHRAQRSNVPLEAILGRGGFDLDRIVQLEPDFLNPAHGEAGHVHDEHCGQSRSWQRYLALVADALSTPTPTPLPPL